MCFMCHIKDDLHTSKTIFIFYYCFQLFIDNILKYGSIFMFAAMFAITLVQCTAIDDFRTEVVIFMYITI